MNHLKTDSPENLNLYIGETRAVLAALEHRTDDSPFYVQSVVVAAYGQPVALLRWDASDQTWNEEEL